MVGQSVRLLHVDEAAFDKFGELALPGDPAKRATCASRRFEMKRKNGEVFATQHSVMPLHDEEGDLVSWVSVIRDITEEKRGEEKLDQYRRKLRKLAAELTVVEARERRADRGRTAREPGAASGHGEDEDRAPADWIPMRGCETGIAEVQELVEEALQQTRSLTYQLSSPILYQLGLEAALKWLAENMAGQYGYRVAFTRLGEIGRSLPEESSVFLFSAVRELLVNVAKHAAASDVAVRLRWLDDCVEVLVKDNGKGFRTDRPLRVRRSEDRESRSRTTASDCSIFMSGCRTWAGGCGCAPNRRRGTAVKIHLPLDRRRSGPSRAAGSREGGIMSIRILLADDHRILREGLRSLLAQQPDIDGGGRSVRRRTAVVALARELRPGPGDYGRGDARDWTAWPPPGGSAPSARTPG